MMEKEFKTIEEFPSYLTGTNVSTYLNISRASGYNLLNSKEFSAIRIGKSIRVKKEFFLKWIEENTGKQNKEGN